MDQVEWITMLAFAGGFLRDVRTWSPLGGAMNGRQIFDDQMMYGADYFYRMWLKADTQKGRIPNP